ncbi:cytochrome b/b6 domain-containing protein [Jannaschia sp. M317]|uniref:cytochrome b/b6 domain-containing protein n=1 Tax=Jannaschia sp. M317 TaxID=2867011 RepID=UPI0021A8A0C0|nr:cytochrome b/b6 domain-containing protein [Jannaschia sp. M317]UWQ17004.1 cytochrome b/b6 domain-containing protein [Jannaschia sp. M317]
MPPRNTAATNTPTAYGWVERAFHWSIALLIPTAIALGVIAHDAPFDTDAALARKAWLFSAHKTVGVVIFFIALARIVWALSQPRPAPLHPDRRAETFAAALVHWLLYGSLVLVPALGWAHHATAEGFAPIWWPFGQGLPFLPKNAELSATLATLHMVFERVMVAALLLHILGAVKHVVIDRDSTLARMWKGTDPGPLPASRGHLLAPGAALVVWAGALGIGLALAPAAATSTAPTPRLAAPATWTVEDGTLEITVTQLGTPVTGRFADWQAAIDFDPTPRADGTVGQVEVAVATGSLTLGSVSGQAIGPDFLAAASHPEARFVATLMPDGDGYVAEGTFSLRGAEMPLRLPFDLTLEGDRARAEGRVTLDRRSFGMGADYTDESNVGFGVTVTVDLTARRLP